MDLRLSAAEATAEEREAVDAVLGAPTSGWDGGARVAARDGHVSIGGHAVWAERHRLLPALEAVQNRVGWISEGAMTYICTRLDVPPAEAYGVATFYALLSMEPRPPRVLHVCDDVVCRTRGAKAITDALGEPHHGPNGDHTIVNGSDTIWLRSPCLGLCDQAPAAFLQVAGAEPRAYLFGDVTPAEAQAVLRHDDSTTKRAHPRIPQQGSPELRLLARVGMVDPTSLDAYRAAGGFEAFRRAQAIGPEGVIREVNDSKLMGRGGAAFPTGKKWEAVAKQGARPHYLICNADESEPGTFKDRVIMEEDPFAIVEAMAIAAYATGCEQGYIYIRGEYPLAASRLENAIRQASARGLLGNLQLALRIGGGAYICGEETAVFNSIEGYRGEPRNKPPFPVESGVFKKPTLINNVETLANIPRIILEGGPAFAAIGAGGMSTGSKLFCLSGAVAKPGVYEVPFGVTLGQMLQLAGGVTGKLQAVLLGGAAGLFVRPDELDMPLTFEGVRAAKATLGSGVIAAFDDTVDLTDILLRIAAFFRDESCGQCVPCRVGTVRQEEALHRIATKRTRGQVSDEIALLDEIGLSMKDASICGLGQTAYSAVESAIKRLRLYE
jgi:NADH-quinone oxidoreductase subunit F